MNKGFEPELGQAVFSNSPWEEIESPPFLEPGLGQIALKISMLRGDRLDNRTIIDNSGFKEYKTSVFEIRPYCWCEGEAEGHEGGCPPNFIHFRSRFVVRWYKHAGRGQSQNRKIGMSEWNGIVEECLASIPNNKCGHQKKHKEHAWAKENAQFNGYWECDKCGQYGFDGETA